MRLAEQPPLHETPIYDPEKRAHNDAETWLAEVLEGTMRTPFEYTFDGKELYAEDGSPMGKVFRDAEIEGARIARKDPHLHFEPRRRKIESEEYECMQAMARGELPNTMIVVSDFPPELMNASKSVGGYNVERKQTMLRVITWDGSKLTMQSQSLDQSNRQALEAIYHLHGLMPQSGELLPQRIHAELNAEEQDVAIDNAMGVYDRSLQQQTGTEWLAGRFPTELGNTYDFVRRNQDIVGQVAALFKAGVYLGPNVYDCAATLKGRLRQEREGIRYYENYEVIPEWDIERQRRLEEEKFFAGNNERALGTTFDGCGASVNGAAADQLSESGYGNKKDETGDCDFISKECPSCGEKNVKTLVKNILGRKHVSGSCGCKKVY